MLTISHEHDPMLPGETFQVYYHVWYKDINQGFTDIILPRTDKRVTLEIVRLYIRSPIELRYVCRCGDHRQLITIAHILVPLYEVKVSHPELLVSALVLTEAAARASISYASPDHPNLYTQEDAKSIINEVIQMAKMERYGYIIPDYQGD